MGWGQKREGAIDLVLEQIVKESLRSVLVETEPKIRSFQSKGSQRRSQHLGSYMASFTNSEVTNTAAGCGFRGVGQLLEMREEGWETSYQFSSFHCQAELPRC